MRSMGLGSSHERLVDNSTSRGSGTSTDDYYVLEHRKQQYLKFIQNLPFYDFFTENLHFTLSKNQKLTKSEMNELYDIYEIPKSKRSLGKGTGYSLQVITRKVKNMKKCIFLFVRESSDDHLYNVIQAESDNSSEINWSHVAIGSVLGLGGAAIFFSVNSLAGGLTMAVTSLALIGKYFYESRYHDGQDIVIGYMITELEKANIITIRDSQCFLRDGGQLIALSSLGFDTPPL